MGLWRVGLLAIAGAVSACTLQLPQVSTETWREPAQSDNPGKAAPGDQLFPDVESVLAYRRSACALAGREQERLLRQWQAEPSDDSTLAILMLASCAPDQTPGLLANHLVKARAIEGGPAGLEEMVALMAAQLRSYTLVERRLREVEARLERMITGLREIETEMGGGDKGVWE